MSATSRSTSFHRTSVVRLHALAILAIVAIAGTVSVRGESPGAPPPSLGSEQTAIPRGIRRVFASSVYPSYLHWLANGDGNEDSLAAFTLFLLSQPVNRHEHWCYVQLYLETR